MKARTYLVSWLAPPRTRPASRHVSNLQPIDGARGSSTTITPVMVSLYRPGSRLAGNLLVLSNPLSCVVANHDPKSQLFYSFHQPPQWTSPTLCPTACASACTSLSPVSCGVLARLSHNLTQKSGGSIGLEPGYSPGHTSAKK